MTPLNRRQMAWRAAQDIRDGMVVNLGMGMPVHVADYVPDVAMYLVLSNSVSSRVGVSGEPDATTVFPNDFAIDYVRVYQPAPPEKLTAGAEV